MILTHFFFLDNSNRDDQGDGDHDDDDDDGDGDSYDEEEDEEGNIDLINDGWNDEVITGDSGDMNNIDNDEGDDNVTKIKIAKTIQKGRSLIKMIKRSQIIMMFINNEKELLNIRRRLIVDCMSRWNSTYLALKSLLQHKPVLSSLFNNKRKLPLTPKQKEKLGLLELSSDDYTILDNLIQIFEPFYNATEFISGSKYPTIGLCLYAIRNIKDFMETEEETDSNILLTLKKFVLESFDQYFDENNDQHFLLTVSHSPC